MAQAKKNTKTTGAKEPATKSKAKTTSKTPARSKTSRGLGRGLASLIPDSMPVIPASEEKPKVQEVVKEVIKEVVKEVPVEVIKEVPVPADTVVKLALIEPNREQPRKEFDEDALYELSESIKQFGVIQPIVVQKKGKFYEIIAGERRWRAAKLAGLKEVPVVIKEYTERERMEIALIENIQREDLNPIEEALAFEQLIKTYKLKQDEVAERVSKSRAAVTNSLRLLKLDRRVQEMVMEGKLSNGHARALLAVEDGNDQFTLAEIVFDQNLSVRDTERLVKNSLKPSKEKEIPKDDFIYRNAEDILNSSIGTKVTIKNRNNNKGKIEIDYYSKEDFERIMKILKR
jgi:ParB family chromosome partitioning protein